MVFNLQAIQSRLQRVQDYFPNPELQSVITGGVITMNPKDMSNWAVHRGLEEGTWSVNLICHPRRDDYLQLYLRCITDLETRSQWGEWKVDCADNPHAPIWVRLIDKLLQSMAKNPQTTFSAENAASVEKHNLRYKNVSCGIDNRRQKHEQFDKDFETIFAGEELAELRQTTRQPLTCEVSPKHCGLLLLEITDAEKRTHFINLYYQALTTHAKNPFAKKLADYFMKHIGDQYRKTFIGICPKEAAELVMRCDEVFRKALAQ